MDDSQQPHQLTPKDPQSGKNDLIFDCPACHKSLVIPPEAAGHHVICPLCTQKILVPERHRVTTLAEAPETQALQSLPAWKQELVTIESSLRELTNQRQEAGNHFKHHSSEVNRLQLRIEKLDGKLQDLQKRKQAIAAEHPGS